MAKQMGDRAFEEQGFCLPSEFLPNKLMNKENKFKNKRKSVVPRTQLPTELPNESWSYYSNNSFLVPPFSVGPNVPGKPWAMASSNQAILSPALGSGSSLVPSPPIAPIGSGRRNNTQGHIRNFTPVNPSNPLPVAATMNEMMWGNQQARGHFGNGGLDVMPGMAWGGPYVQNQGRSFGGAEMSPVGYGGGVKRGCAGTGVFLPRRFPNTIPESRKKTGGSTSQPPPRVAQASNKKFENVFPQPQPQRQFIGSGHIPENGFVMARRNAAMAQELSKREMMMPNNAAAARSARGMGLYSEIRLPHEWTY